jgi:hypothetical protein
MELLPPNVIVENQETTTVILHDAVRGARKNITVKHDAILLNVSFRQACVTAANPPC